jgi:glutamine amidotransferase
MLVIVNYGVGNLNSIRNILHRAGHESVISDRLAEIQTASKLLLPGMGHFDNCMQKFSGSGLRAGIEKRVFQDKIPLLGICVGLQMFMERSEEGKEPGLGWIKGETYRFNPADMQEELKIPHMGWREVAWQKPSRLSENLSDSRFYFAHSYHVRPAETTDTLVTAEYGSRFVAGVEKDNLVGVQFHPEKSHRFGMQLLKNFVERYF